MTTTELERRVAVLEKKMEFLTTQKNPPTNKKWLLDIWGSFSGDSDFEEAARYGKKWRDAENRKSLRSMTATASRKRRK